MSIGNAKKQLNQYLASKTKLVFSLWTWTQCNLAPLSNYKLHQHNAICNGRFHQKCILSQWEIICISLFNGVSDNDLIILHFSDFIGFNKPEHISWTLKGLMKTQLWVHFKRYQFCSNEVSMCWLVIYGRDCQKMQSKNNEFIESTTSNLKLFSGSPDAYEKAYSFFSLSDRISDDIYYVTSPKILCSTEYHCTNLLFCLRDQPNSNP